ncbi:MAG: hypothetical protein C5B48_11835 [Candidatus Rokuibacteriota bacterium]|nr:MAG: hypothetical protein C5B48_11835 [Candidatus Rokubacteria bacterium]
MAIESKDIRDRIADPAFRRAIPDDWLRPKLADSVTRLEEEAARCATPPVLAARQPRLLAGRALVADPGVRAAGSSPSSARSA